jgi:hypothetical protein
MPYTMSLKMGGQSFPSVNTRFFFNRIVFGEKQVSFPVREKITLSYHLLPGEKPCFSCRFAYQLCQRLKKERLAPPFLPFGPLLCFC